MAKITTIFGFRDDITPGLKKVKSEVNSLSNEFSNMAMTAMGISSISQIADTIINKFHELSQSINECISAYQYQSEQELKLETIMKQRMNASAKEIQSIKDLASAQGELGIYGDEIILQGAQELASFTSNTEAIKTLIPAMNNLIAQQYGFSASGREFQSTADMMGKVLSGQTGALSRMGYVFSEEEKQMLKTGNEMERASTLAKIITDNVGEMNEALRQTSAGNIQYMNNTIGDLKEQLGQAIMPFKAMFTLATSQWKISFYKGIINALNYLNNHPIVRALLKGLVVGAIIGIAGVIASTLLPMLGGVIASLVTINALNPIGWLGLAVGGITALAIGINGIADRGNDAIESLNGVETKVKDIEEAWKQARNVIFNGTSEDHSDYEKMINSYSVGLQKAAMEINKIYDKTYGLTGEKIDWKKGGSLDPKNILSEVDLQYVKELKAQYDDFNNKMTLYNNALKQRNDLLEKQAKIQEEINKSNEKYKDTLEQIHNEYLQTDIGKDKALEEKLKEYEQIYKQGYMKVAKEGMYGELIYTQKGLTTQEKTELGIVIDVSPVQSWNP